MVLTVPKVAPLKLKEEAVAVQPSGNEIGLPFFSHPFLTLKTAVQRPPQGLSCSDASNSRNDSKRIVHNRGFVTLVLR